MAGLTNVIEPSVIRSKFSRSISELYRKEVPLYADLLSIVSEVNTQELSKQPELEAQLRSTGELGRLSLERHGAIRLGTAKELRIMGRLFRVMNMHPVGYYDLSAAGVPVHATCFRPCEQVELSRNPFRMFTSVLRLELIPSDLRKLVERILSRRRIFSNKMLELIAKSEINQGLTASEADEYVVEAMKTFAWHSTAVVTLDEYELLKKQNPLLADVTGFRGTHINHLTPRTLNIDEVQISMNRFGIPAKDTVEGPPARNCPILLRQTSFKALEEKVKFRKHGMNFSPGSFVLIEDDMTEEADGIEGGHKARFGEIEQRGAALTPKGLEVYNSMLSQARRDGIDSRDAGYHQIFSKFPDTWKEIHDQELAWFFYKVAKIDGFEREICCGLSREDVRELLIGEGFISYEPLVYEDFLPVSAAGIFQSNLGVSSEEGVGNLEADSGDQQGFQNALGDLKILSQMELYEVAQRESLDRCLSHFGLDSNI